jgi:hypothetical protein
MIMKKNPKAAIKATDDLRPEYRLDYSQSRPNRFAPMFANGELAVVLEPDVASVFNTSESVNTLLRSVIAVLPKKSRPGGAKRRKKVG